MLRRTWKMLKNTSLDIFADFVLAWATYRPAVSLEGFFYGWVLSGRFGDFECCEGSEGNGK